MEVRFESFLAFGKRCRERDSNPHDRFGSRDFKSLVSTNSTIAAPDMLELYGFCDCKGSVISSNSQTFYTLFNINIGTYRFFYYLCTRN